ncbi:hypothetical protein Tco_1377658 [Tanacetum coccineum]
MVHDLDRFFNGVESVVDLDFIQLNGKSFAGQGSAFPVCQNISLLSKAIPSTWPYLQFEILRVCVSRRHNSFLDDHYYPNSVVLLVFSGSLVMKSMATFFPISHGVFLIVPVNRMASGNFMPPKPYMSFYGLEEFTSEPIVIKPIVEKSEATASEAKPKAVRKNNGAPIIED